MSAGGPSVLAALPHLPSDERGPVFAEPWQAQAFAMAVSLSGQGHFTWKEWAAALAKELEGAANRGESDDGSRYYEHWLAALEKLVTEKGLAEPAALITRKEAWATAYRTTPHGQPVELLQSTNGPEAPWLVLGLGCTLAVYGLLPHVDPFFQWDIWSWNRSQAASAIPSGGIAASAGLGTLLGMRHALEPDHLAAISTLMTGERRSAKAAWLGAWWGLGHTLTLLTTGTALLMLRAEMPAIAAQMFELCVVVLLVGFGVRALYQGACRVSVRQTHSHARSAVSSPSRVGRGTVARPFLVGAVHGLAGSGALIALVVITLPSTLTRLIYLTLFGVGSTVGMAALSGLLGWPIARSTGNRIFARSIAVAVGSVSTALGLYWGYPDMMLMMGLD
jgi:nitrile hydratase accessory protein